MARCRSESERWCVISQAAPPPRAATQTAAIAARCRVRLLRKFGRCALNELAGRFEIEAMGCGFGLGAETGLGLEAPGLGLEALVLAPPARQVGSGGSRLRQSSQTPLSPGDGE